MHDAEQPGGVKTRGYGLLDAAKEGDATAFEQLVDPHRGELRAHCYQMLGSLHDAEDSLQDALLRAWKGIDRFEGRSSLRSWLYSIATNTCLDEIERRPKRFLPIEYSPATDPAEGPGKPVAESVWVEPYPDGELEIGDGHASPDARYERREAIELAFIAALQHLPANQRAVLILRDALGFSAKETADQLGTSVASVTSALQRARVAVDERTPERSQQETLRSLGDERVAAIVSNYVEAWERGDVEAVVGMLAEDSTFSMPPMSSWFAPRDQIREWMATSPLSGAFTWKALRTRANSQETLGFYNWDKEAGKFVPFALNVLTFRDETISDVVAFIARSSMDPDPQVQQTLPDQPFDAAVLGAAFERFGLPPAID